MKRIFITVLTGLSFGFGAWAAPEELYINYGVVTNPPQVDAVGFVNQGTISFNTVNVNSNFIYPIGQSAGYNSIPFSTKDTLNFTNETSGFLLVTNGLDFETITATTAHPAQSFVNDGIITGFDFPAVADTYSTSAGTTGIAAGSVPVASDVEILASNVYNDGTISVGNAGLIHVVAGTITNLNGALVAGAINTGGGGGVEYDHLDTTGGGDSVPEFTEGSFFVNAPGVYDLYWGETATEAALALNNLDTNPEVLVPEISGVFVAGRQTEGATAGFGLPLSLDPQWMAIANAFIDNDSNTFFNIVIVNTNFVDLDGLPNTNIAAEVRFTDTGFEFDGGDFASEPMVKFSLTVPDVITGQMVTNSVYLVDFGGVVSEIGFSESQNAATGNAFERPDVFDITTTQPNQWDASHHGNVPYDGSLIFAPGIYNTEQVVPQVAAYGVQIGRNPGILNGMFPFPNLGDDAFFETSEGSIFGSSTTKTPTVVLPDPTNEPARIELTANQLDLSNARLRAEGMAIMNITNLAGAPMAGRDWGQINSRIGATNGSLVISNFYPTNFQRLRGNIYAYTGNWINTATNNTVYNNVSLTNIFHYNIFIVDQNLCGNFQSASRNIHLIGTNSIVVQDPLYIINQDLFTTSNLTFNNNVVFTQNAGNLMPSNMPTLENFFCNTNGSVTVDSIMDFGYDTTKTPVPPVKRKYTVLSVTNFGTMTATAPLFQSEFFENDGTITAGNNGSMIINAAELGLGLALTNATNELLADGNVTLSAISMGITNSVINAGTPSQPGAIVLQTTATGQITDFVPGTASTNSYTTNIWQVTDGFSLPVLPQGNYFGAGTSSGLFGTEIISVVTNNTVALHTWAGADLGASMQGFNNNMVIGHLKLSRQTSSAALHFTGAGAQNGLYVDYLELDTNNLGSGTNYKYGIIIDPNLTIYFAACNVDPIKLETVYSNRMVWVPSFAGPNSSISVPYTNCAGDTQYCLLNASLAVSTAISFFGSVPNSDNQPFVLNDPDGNCESNALSMVSCGGGAVTDFRDFIVPNGADDDLSLGITVKGEGRITPELKQKNILIGGHYSLTATPAAGWIFSGWKITGAAEVVDTTSRSLTFTLGGNAMVTASFIPRMFTQEQGTYNGLFMDPSNQLGSANSGAFTLTVQEDGAFSGKLMMGPVNYSFSDRFPAAGTIQTVAGHGGNTIPLSLTLDMTGKSGQVTGYVGVPAVQLLGNITQNWGGKDASPYAGRYTMLLTNGATNLSIGDSYGTVTISKEGVLTVQGKLADGNSFNQSVPVAADGLWPFYAYVPEGGDFLVGWIPFELASADRPQIGKTNVYWGKAASANYPHYPGGFTNIFGVTGSSYNGSSDPLPHLTTPEVILTGGDLAANLSNSVALKGKTFYSNSNLTLRINPSAGSFNGSLRDVDTGLSLKLSGAVLQDENAAFGYFLGTNGESGTVLLQQGQ